MKFFSGSIRVILSILIIAGGILIARYFIKTKPQTKKKKTVKIRETFVETLNLKKKSVKLFLKATGSVEPEKILYFKPQVSGKIVYLDSDFEKGSFFNSGQLIGKIESQDYELKIIKAKAALQKAEHDIEIEQGKQKIAEMEFNMTDRKVTDFEKNIMLRLPQYKMLKSNMQSAQASYGEALLSLERTKLLLPFNANVLTKDIVLGSYVTPSNIIAKVVGTDRFNIVIQVTADKLKWLKTAGNDKFGKVKFFNEFEWGTGNYREGFIKRKIFEIDEKNRQVQLLASVNDPFCLLEQNKEKPQIIIGQFLDCEINCGEIQDAFEISSEYMRDDNTVWIMDDENKLQIKKVKIIWINEDSVIVKEGLTENIKIVKTNLSAPVSGMKLTSN